jgi:hypothetical protein
MFTFGAGFGGDLVDLVLLIAYFDLASVEQIGEFFVLLDEGFKSQSFDSFSVRYRDRLAKLKDWWIPVEEIGLLEKAPYREEIRRLSEILIGNYTAYAEQVWPKESPRISHIANRLNTYFGTVDLIGDWEKLLGVEFRSPGYTILLTSALKNGPNANSLGYDCNIFYSETNYDWMRQFVSHEVGTHILIDILNEVGNSGEFEWQLVYGGFECLAKFFNQMILHQEELVYKLPKFHDEQLIPIFKSIYRQDSTLEPRKLLVTALGTFEKWQIK